VVSQRALAQGQVWWADLPVPVGSGPGYRRPVLVVQANRFNRSTLATVVVVPLSSSVHLADMPGNVLLDQAATGLRRTSVANVSAIVSIDRSLLEELVSQIDARTLELVLAGIDILLGR
jgi:mRNA interferase MazF